MNNDLPVPTIVEPRRSSDEEAPLPRAFVWTKMGAESGEALVAIIRRKEYERQLGDGVFAWGIGNALGSAVTALTAEEANPMVVFSVMPSKPKKEDTQPASILLWTTYEDANGAAHPLPAHMIITSRGQAGGNDKVRHYALFCQSMAPLLDTRSAIEGVAPAALRNLATGNPLGSSQVTAVVRRMGSASSESRRYPVAFTASLAGVRYARLLTPRALSAIDVADMAAATTSGLATWAQFVQWIRRPIDHIAGASGYPLPRS